MQQNGRNRLCVCARVCMQYTYVVILHGTESIPTVVIGFHCKLMHFESANEMKMSIVFPEYSIYANRYIFGVTVCIYLPVLISAVRHPNRRNRYVC
jgi:hypothetical protein